MADFQRVQKRGVKSTTPTVKYSTQKQQLAEMGFDAKNVEKALDTTNGNFDDALALLIDSFPAPAEPAGATTSTPPVAGEKEKKHKSEKKSERPPRQTKSEAAPAPVPAAVTGTAEELAEVHRKMMETYKITKCKESASKTHDRKNCMHWHTPSDRRRNPFEYTYSSYECPNVVGGSECPVGDECGHSHSMLERMFHPELYKISYCERLQGGKKCDRGVYCAFAHTAEDLRTSPSKLDPALADKPPAKPVIADIVIPEEIKERLLQLIRDSGKEGVHSSELYKKYQIKYNEPLDFWADKYGAKYKMKEMLEAHPNVHLEYSRGHQPVYVYVEGGVASASTEGSDAKSGSFIRDRIVQIVKDAGEAGILSVDIPKKYNEVYKEKLEYVDASGERIKLRETLLACPGITANSGSKQQHLRYSFDATLIVEKPKVKSWSAIAAAADKPKPAPVVVAAPAPTPAPAVVVEAAPAVPTKKAAETPVVESAEKKSEKPVHDAPEAAPAKSSNVKSFASVVASKAKAKETPAPAAPAVAPASVPETVPESAETKVEAKKEEPSVAVEVSSSVVDQLLAAVSNSIPESAPSVPFPQSAVLSGPSGLTLPGENPTMSKLVANVAIGDINDNAVSLPPSVFPLSGDNALSSSLLFGINNKTDDQNNGSQQLKLHDLLYKASTLDMKREHSIMPPGLTRQTKSDKPDEDLSRKLSQTQAQVASQQEQINALQKELATRKTEFETQSAQLKSTQAMLKEAESRSDESLRAQLKAKEEEFHAYLLQFQEELKRVHQERTVDYNSAYMFFDQMELYLDQKNIDEKNVEMYSKERLIESTKILPQIRAVCSGWKQQWKYKVDMLNQRHALPFHTPYAAATGRGFPMQYPGAPMYDHAYFGGQQFPVYGQQSYTAPQGCAFPGCPQPGAFPCTGCYRVSYCSQEHQQMHYAQHASSCH